MDVSNYKEPTTNFIKFEKKGDAIRGVYLKTSIFDGKFGPTKNYHMKLLEAEVKGHDLTAGENYTFFGHFTIDDHMENLQPGQEFSI